MSNPVEHIRRYQTELSAFRRDIHAHPELAFQESRTSDRVAEQLERWGIEVHRGLATTGLVGVIPGRRSAPRAVGLRADMDCLPMHETAERPHKSRNAGRMHACGHDGHTTMLLGAARYLSETRNFAGTAYVIFQPAEEHGGGGNVMVQEGLFERFPANEVYALHNWPGLPAGQIGVRAGPVLAATDEIRIDVRGRGGHAAMPHLSVDPVVVTAHIITALQTIASRNVNPLDAIVVSLCSMETSQLGAFNVIPDAVTLIGTVRTFRSTTQELAEQRIREIATSVAAALGGSAELEYIRGYPATVNTPREAEFAAHVAARIFGQDNVVREFDPTMGGEDFAYMLQAKPGAYLLLGQGGGPSSCYLHNPGYDFNDEVIPLGAGYLAALAEDALPLA
ncbi:MAG TPA: M20 aminoacylase family protein [Burkholderiales bacterium]|nr:M20 aminoacylase family protein [Burkholderiales bacterium]